jgi:hypothetical protein
MREARRPPACMKLCGLTPFDRPVRLPPGALWVHAIDRPVRLRPSALPGALAQIIASRGASMLSADIVPSTTVTLIAPGPIRSPSCTITGRTLGPIIGVKRTAINPVASVSLDPTPAWPIDARQRMRIGSAPCADRTWRGALFHESHSIALRQLAAFLRLRHMPNLCDCDPTVNKSIGMPWTRVVSSMYT